MSLIEIPPMTDSLSRYWGQPDVRNFAIDDEVAMMSQKDFEALLEYSTTIPSAVYEGKCWRACYGGVWYLRWFGKDDGDPKGLPTFTRKIVLV